MPIHDWTRVTAGAWHAFHLGWISQLQAALNGGLLPEDYYSLAEQDMDRIEPDVLTLQSTDETDSFGDGPGDTSDEGGVSLALAPPKTKQIAELEIAHSVRKRRTLSIRHNSDDRIVALLELVSPGNKSSKRRWAAFVSKSVACLERGYHLLIVDLFPPAKREPNGVHGAIWDDLGDGDYVRPEHEPLTLVSYLADSPIKAYIEPTVVGATLIDMPLFLTTERYVNVPLEATYAAAYQAVPRKLKAILEAT